ncbi:MAG: hypothetical protein COY81_05430 [Candidatus Pacebacteria bacterium CG_4_10_14_0_8_um_filter_43_12]|nr:MAG: hypothetical protein COU66_00140 [Candidatus Pacebacteria bacterium CG10_big_fil_rev_8_21_14_0_10_44_11]PIY78919.1 MAG: hypothetical protein COY81_05430 [Candidatus Pacebacteria bacterium CG_4_10_14_0_8_um_filter_43_12]
MAFGQLRLSSEEKIGLVSNISTMLAAGIPIVETITSLLEEAKGNQRKILLSLQDDVTAGKQISESFARYPLAFDDVTVNLIKAAEEAGTLETTLKDLQKTIIEEREFSDKVKSAMFYPLIVLVIFFAVLLMMLLVVIPRISTVFSHLNVVLPLPTKILIFVSNVITHHWLLVSSSTAALIATVIILYSIKREMVLGVFFKLPLVSTLVRQIDITRFSRSLHLLLASGIPITTSLELAQAVILKKEVRVLVAKARDQAQAGHPFSAGLRSKQNIIPSMMIKLMEVGEKSGTLEESMLNVSENMDYTVSQSIKKLTAMLEPIMLVLVGLAVGGMMLAIIAPIYNLIGQVGR